MITYTITTIILALTGVIQGSLFSPSNGYEYAQRTSKPTTFVVNLPLYQRIAAALTALNSNGAHHDSTGCVLNHHPHDPEQGEVVQSAAYPHANYQYQPSQWTPVVYGPPIAYNHQPLPYNAPVAYHHQGPVNRARHRTPTGFPLPAFQLEGVPSADYGYPYPPPLY